MNSDNGAAGQMQQPMKCVNPDCQKEFVVLVPPAEAVNMMTLSMVLWSHPEPQSCPYCGTPYQMMVKSIQGVVTSWGPVRTKRDSAIVVPPANFRVPTQ